MIFERVRVFDGSTFIECADVVVDGETISSVTERDGAPARTLLPGFVDSHVHLGFFEPRAVLRGGVTTAVDLGWPWDVALEGGPDVLRAGQILTAPGGYPSRAAWAPPGTAREMADAGDARTAVAEQVARGARLIKVAQEPRDGATPSDDVLRAAVEEARARGLRVTSHCGSLREVERAIDCGVEQLAHGLWSDERIPDATLARAPHMTIVPTLHIEPSDVRLDNVRRCVAAGCRVLYGTDMGNPPAPGAIDPEEIALMTRAGLSLEEALASATSRAAAYLGLDDRGRIESGARGDLVLVDGDPRTHVRALGAIAGVWKVGARA